MNASKLLFWRAVLRSAERAPANVRRLNNISVVIFYCSYNISVSCLKVFYQVTQFTVSGHFVKLRIFIITNNFLESFYFKMRLIVPCNKTDPKSVIIFIFILTSLPRPTLRSFIIKKQIYFKIHFLKPEKSSCPFSFYNFQIYTDIRFTFCVSIHISKSVISIKKIKLGSKQIETYTQIYINNDPLCQYVLQQELK